MSNTTQFQYPNGSDEEVLKALAQKLAETLPLEDYSMSQYLSPEMPVWITGPPNLEENELSPPAGRDQIHSESEGVSAVLRELADAIIRRDAPALDQLLTDDYAGWFPKIENNGYSFWKPIGKTQQIAEVEKRGSSVENFEFKKLRVYPAEGGEKGAIAVFIGIPLFSVDGIASNKKCGYYVRFDKQPERWKASIIQMAPTFDMTPPLFPSGVGGESVSEFEFDPDGRNLKDRK